MIVFMDSNVLEVGDRIIFENKVFETTGVGIHFLTLERDCFRKFIRNRRFKGKR